MIKKLIITAFVCTVFAYSIIALGFIVEKTNPVTKAEFVQEKPSGLPVRLKIPSIGVDARIKPVGLTADGAMDVPAGPADVAWFDLGPRPGEIGSAVVAGHYWGWNKKNMAVFDNLSKLRSGDIVSVVNDKGSVISFVVRETRIYSRDADVPEVFASDSGVHLNLITCAGAWDNIKKLSAERLVVFTDLVQK